MTQLGGIVSGLAPEKMALLQITSLESLVNIASSGTWFPENVKIEKILQLVIVKLKKIFHFLILVLLDIYIFLL